MYKNRERQRRQTDFAAAGIGRLGGGTVGRFGQVRSKLQRITRSS